MPAVPAPLPANEAQRLLALRSLRILDTPPEPQFDDLTALAAAVSGCPIALVSLIDENRQWFKAKCGIDAIETDRSVAFCAHALLGEDIFEIPDACEDGRFASNPLVVGAPHIRFYAGMPLISAERLCYGTLCVIDTQPRRLDARQRDLLRKLARQVLLHMEARAEHQQARSDSRSLAQGLGFMQEIVDAAEEVSIITTDNSGRITLFNTGAERLLGYTAAELVDRHTPAVFHLPAQVEQRGLELSAQYGREIAGFDVFVHEVRLGGTDTRQWIYVCRDGSHRQVRLSVCALRDDDHRIIGFMGMAVDLTPQLAAEEAARLGRERFYGAFTAAAQGMTLTSLDGRYVEINDALCNMFGYSRDELQALTFRDVTHPDDLDSDLQMIARLLSGDIANYHLEKRYLRKNGEVLYALLSVSLVRDRSGKPLHFVKQIQDLTLQKRMERMKDELISTVSHELRTPLTSISGALGLVQGGVLGEVPESMREVLGIAHQNSLRLAVLINDLLDMDKLIAGKMNFNFQTCALVPLLDEALATMANYAAPLGVRLERQGNEPVLVSVDPLRLGQVLANLLSNACKFSPRDSVVVLSHAAGAGFVEVSVRDHGPGIPAAFREHIFQKFSQAESASRHSKGGTGLGLAICKELITRMRGELGFESDEGQGSRFWFRLPLPPRGDGHRQQ